MALKTAALHWLRSLYSSAICGRCFSDSPVAKDVLENWRLYERAWVKVMPQDFKRVLAEREEKHVSSVRATKLSPDGGQWMETGHGIDGVPDHG